MTVNGAERYGMTAVERLLLYDTAIQTGLRSNELRSLTRGGSYLDVERPFITCKSGAIKSKKGARKYIQREFAVELQAHIAIKASKAPVFNMPHRTNVARMLRDDLTAARKSWMARP